MKDIIGACSTDRGYVRNIYKTISRGDEGHVGDTDIGGTIILKWI
jgi:hypothetical protein